MLAQLPQFVAPEAIDAVVLSHYHADHVADLHCLQYATRIQIDLGRRQTPLAVYGHAEDHHFDSLTYLDYATGYPIDENTALELGDISFTFARNDHPDPCFSMRIEHRGRVLVYIADTQWNDRLIPTARDADLLICESSLYDQYKGVVPGHLTAGEAGRIAESANAAALVLSHLPHFGNHEDLLAQAAAVYRGPVELARIGRSWEL